MGKRFDKSRISQGYSGYFKDQAFILGDVIEILYIFHIYVHCTSKYKYKIKVEGGARYEFDIKNLEKYGEFGKGDG